jgi:uncharacterized protein YsxB (DUF464 family)
MLRVQVERAADGRIRGFAVRGHAGVGVRGQDIVCAGVSALSQTAVLGLQRRLGVAPEVSAGAGLLVCRLPEGLPPALAERAQDVLETMCLGMAEIAAAYPAAVGLAEGPLGNAARRGG